MMKLVNCNYTGCTGYDEFQPFNCHHGCKDPSSCESFIWWNTNLKADAELDKALDNLTASDSVNSPPHYNQYPVEVINMIQLILGRDGFKDYCLGNEIKYRMRAGFKTDASEDLAKAMWYHNKRKET